MSEWDAVVVGGGPAGAALAARLAGAGHAVLVLDRERFPRPKPCGECLNPAAIRALDRLGVLDAVRAAPHAELEGWEIRPHRGPGFLGRFPSGERGVAISRTLLDPLLLEHARRSGASVRTGDRVTDLLREGGRVVGVRIAGRGAEAEIRARLVVGADGLRSVVSRRLGLVRRQPRLRKIALTAHVRGLDRLATRGELHLFPWGCVGIAPVGGGSCNVTVVVGSDEARHLAGARDRYFDRVLGEAECLRGGERVTGVLATGPFDWPTRRAVADGAMLVGDAAGYYDPFTGQGIFRALRGAELAAATADPALRAGTVDAAALRPYDRARLRAFGPTVRLQRLIEGVTARPRLFALAAARLARRPALADALVAVTGDLRPVRSLLRPRLLAALVG